MTAHVLERAGSRLHYWLAGPERAPLVVFTHGASMDHGMFDEQVPAVVGAGYRVLTWDVRGHGRSKPLGDRPVSVRALAADLLAVLDEIDRGEPVCLVGQSLGGYLAQDIVFTHPHRVAVLGIIGSTCATLPIPWWQRWSLAASPLMLRLWPDGDLRRRIAQRTAETSRAREYALAATQRLTKDEFVAVWGAVAKAIHPEPGYRIEHPLLLCHGDRDRVGDVAETAPRWAARDPRCRYEVVPNAGHNANQDNPEWFNQILMDFLAAHFPPGGAG
ncbi:Lysophospholipase, alpha-beta hydrolase superfamily [Amycolatopsis arida]|uniref:Lysophospholipase, alpha-beta hydrolase superfamily n=1 Tax=Amycolatopsis arida TaxID=587909 RepID=A0A1I5XVS2_9PSEU|nr:alpha/beta hydrolase [Amycolatopsis arida]TDX97235.1 alpha-beta hydrolase superfamily lysophospholipase [Amycolatopsis arida]SFQ36053.1 Lysophospholipase, alpha-beta hydrolase superfamily [Amycolatopsis arida]